MAETYDFDVFLSYSSKDHAVVGALAKKLLADGLRVWFDKWQIQVADHIPSKIEHGLERSRILLICKSLNSTKSDWSKMESGAFRFRDPLNHDRRFIVLRLDEAPLENSLAQFSCVNWMPQHRKKEYPLLLNACRLPESQCIEPTGTIDVESEDVRGVAECKSPNEWELAPDHKSILVVEDNLAMQRTLVDVLTQDGFRVDTANDGFEALAKVRSQKPDLIILDLGLPLLRGEEVLRRLRLEPATKDIYVMIVSGHRSEADQVIGFAQGADDYVIKSSKMSRRVLLQRVHAMFRRRRVRQDDDTLIVRGPIEIDCLNRRCTLDGNYVDLSPNQLRILLHLSKTPGRAYSREQLLEVIQPGVIPSLDRVIDMQIRALRSSLGKYASLIETVRGVGYQFRGIDNY